MATPEVAIPEEERFGHKSRKEHTAGRRRRSSSPRSSNWKAIEFTEDHYAKPVLIDTNKLLIASGDLNENVYTYNIAKRKLKLLFKYPEKMEPFQVATCVDHNSQTLYLYCTYTSRENVFMEYDMNSKELKTYSKDLKDTGAFPVLCCLHGHIHLIGGRLNSLHLVWDEKQHKFTERFFRTKMLHGHAVIPLESSKQILVLGGNESHLWGGYLDGMWLCDTLPKIKWRQLPSTLPHKMFHFGYIKTKDESKVIIFGGKTKNTLSSEIWILNIASWEWTKSDVKCPKKGKFYAVKSRDGYVHLFEVDTKHYWKAKLSLILGTPRSMRSGSVSSVHSDSMDDHHVFDDEKQKTPPFHTRMNSNESENMNDHDRPDLEHKVVELHNENQRLKKHLKKAKEKIDALIQQNVKLNKDMRQMEDEHAKQITELQDELNRYKSLLSQ